MRPLFFELVREFETFSVWLKADRLQPTKGKYNYAVAIIDPNAADQGVTEISQVETVYLRDENGKIEPLIKVTNSETLSTAVPIGNRRGRSKMLDPDLLIGYVTEPVYEKLKEYAKTNNLKFKRKQDFVKILDYYAEISNQ